MFGGWNKIFNRQIIDVHEGTWENVTYYILAAQTIHFELFIIEQNKFLPINRDQWELDAKTKHLSIGEFNLSTTDQTSARLSGSFRL